MCGSERSHDDRDHTSGTQRSAGPLQSWRLCVSAWASISIRPSLLLETFLRRQGFLLKPPGFVSTMQFASWFLFNGRF
jgi:hypothetical protein